MTMHNLTPNLPRSFERYEEEVDDTAPTLRYTRTGDGSTSVRLVPRDCRGTLPAPPPSPWPSIRDRRPETVPRPSSRKKRRSLLPFVTLALAIAIGIGLWRDSPTRARVASDLVRAASQAKAFVVGLVLG